MANVGVAELAAIVFYLALILPPCVKIVRKAGYSGIWALLSAVRW